MRILSRHLVHEMTMPMLFGVCAFTSLFVSGDLLNLANLVVETGAPIAAALKVFLLKLPQIVVWTFSGFRPPHATMRVLVCCSSITGTGALSKLFRNAG
jgi:lipopolysaccharide export system permease protein